MYIFGVNPSNKLNQYHLYKIFLFLLVIWGIVVVVELIIIKQYAVWRFDMIKRGEENIKQSKPSIIMITLLTFILINPAQIMFRPFRYELIVSMFYNIISPFGLVRFKDFFLGDILTSMVRPLIDVYFIGCYFGTGEWEASV